MTTNSQEEPARHEHDDFDDVDVNLDESAADYDAEETNPKASKDNS